MLVFQLFFFLVYFVLQGRANKEHEDTMIPLERQKTWVWWPVASPSFQVFAETRQGFASLNGRFHNTWMSLMPNSLFYHTHSCRTWPRSLNAPPSMIFKILPMKNVVVPQRGSSINQRFRIIFVISTSDKNLQLCTDAIKSFFRIVLRRPSCQ